MSIDEILIFKHAGVNFGVDVSVVNQIVRIPDITSFELSQKEILGLCNVAGSITAVLDINMLLGTPKVNLDDANARLLTLGGSLHVNAMVVDSVVNTIEVDSERFEPSDSEHASVIGIYKHEDEIIQIVDFTKLVATISHIDFTIKDVKEGRVKEIIKDNSLINSSRYLLYTMQDEMYALDIDNLREIILIPETYTQIASSSKEVRGMLSLRDELLVIIDLREYYGFKAEDSDKNRILIAQIGEKKIGLIVDEIIDIKAFSNDLIDIIPENFEDKKLSGVIQAKEGLISLMGEAIIKELFKNNEQFESSITTDEEELRGDNIEVVTFTLNDEEYALDIDTVVEIIDSVETTYVAEAAKMIRGVINIRGQVVPIGSLNYQLGIDESHATDDKILICTINKETVGFYVDTVTDILHVKQDNVREDSDDASHFSSILHLNDGKRLIMMLDSTKLLDRKEVV